MKLCVLASGSKGNCTYIETEQCKVLIDIGTTSLYAEKKLKEIEINPKEVNGILITHTHSDHISGLINLLDLANWYYKDMDVFLLEIIN